MTEEQHCVAQLRRLGVEPDSVGHVVQTHLHIDHTGALGHFPDATIVVHPRELECARAAESASVHGYVRADYDRPSSLAARRGADRTSSATARSACSRRRAIPPVTLASA